MRSRTADARTPTLEPGDLVDVRGRRGAGSRWSGSTWALEPRRDSPAFADLDSGWHMPSAQGAIYLAPPDPGLGLQGYSLILHGGRQFFVDEARLTPTRSRRPRGS